MSDTSDTERPDDSSRSSSGAAPRPVPLPAAGLDAAAAAALEAEARALVACGEHATAAARFLDAGLPQRAGVLYEQIFEHRLALSAFKAAGDSVAAVRVAITLGDNDAVARLVEQAIQLGQGDALLSALARAGRHAEVGRVYRARGELLAAASAFEQAERWDEAAWCHEELGHAREAGLLLERWLELHPGDEEAALHLGRILLRFGRHDDAIALLQQALARAPHPALTRLRASPTLMLAFVQLGYHEAARAVLVRWKAAHQAEAARRRAAATADATPGGAADAQVDAAVDAAGAAAAGAHAAGSTAAAAMGTNTTSAAARAAPSWEEPPATLDAFLASARVAAFAAIQASDRASRSGGGSRPPAATPVDDIDAFFGGAPGGGTADAAAPARGGEAVAAEAEADAQQLLLAGRYLLGEPLGGGGVGQVFRAHDAFSDQPVAVKIFGAQALASEALKSWARDVRAAAALGHPALVRLVELNMAQGYIVTELLGAGGPAGGPAGGGDGTRSSQQVLLEQRLQEGGDAGWVLPWLRATLDALGTCHRTGLVHGGLKPRNVFLVPGAAKLLDIGAHRLLALRSTETGGLSSVWPYLSPEMLFGAPSDVDGDLYAVAAILYRALSGRPPFASATASRTTAPLPLEAHNPTAPAGWSAFLGRALHPDRSQRFHSAESFLDALPPLPPGLGLPAAAPVDASERLADQATLDAGQADRYLRGTLAWRATTPAAPTTAPTAGGDADAAAHGDVALRAYHGTDTLVGRPVWILEADDARVLTPLLVAARMWRGLQPVYDVQLPPLPAGADPTCRPGRVVLARDDRGPGGGYRMVDFEHLRQVPQGLARDLGTVAAALTALHQAGLCLGGFAIDRARGPVGPRLRLCPAPLPLPHTVAGAQADWESLAVLVATAFGVPPDESQPPTSAGGPALPMRRRLLAELNDRRLLGRVDIEALDTLGDVSQTPWPAFLEALTERLVAGAQGRVVARLVRGVVSPG